MQNIICQALAYNEYDWNRQAGIVYAHKKAAEQLHLILTSNIAAAAATQIVMKKWCAALTTLLKLS